MLICDALEMSRYRVVTAIGGGGKTSVLLALAQELSDQGLKTILTTTTRMAYGEIKHYPVLLGESLPEISRKLNTHTAWSKPTVVGTRVDSAEKLLGINKEWLGAIIANKKDWRFLIEGDGAARKPFKAPAEHEPLIPEATDLLLGLIGVEAIGAVLAAANVHRPEQVSALTGIPLGGILTAPVIAHVLLHPAGYRKNMPLQANYVIMINKVETREDLQKARHLAGLLLAGGCCKIVLSALQSPEKIVEVIDR